MIQKCAPTSTGMMAINLTAVAIGKILALSSDFSDITIACYNSPDDHVVSGPVARLQALKSYLDGAVGCKSVLLPVGFGYHSGAMAPLQEDLTSLATGITISPPIIPITSNVYGKLVLPGDASVFDAQYYSRHCTEPVLFDQGIRGSVTLDSLPVIDAWIEIGPHATILPTLKRHPVFPKDALFLASMWKRQDPLASLHSALARLYVSPLASEMKWRNVFSYLPFVSNTSLPTYPWSNASFWVSFKEEIPPTYKTDPPPGSKARNPRLPYAVLHACIQSPFVGNRYSFVFETPMSHLSKLICGHRVRELPLCPASTYQELALAGVEASIQLHHSAFKQCFVVLHDIDFQSPLVYTEGTCCAIQTSIIFESEDAGAWKVITTNGGEKIHAHGGFQLQRPSNTISRFSLIYPIVSHRVAAIASKRDGNTFTTSSIYQVIFPRVVTYGKNYRAVRTLTISAEGTEGYATVQLPNNSDRDYFVVHPILMDAMLHVAGFIANLCGGVNDAFICSKVGCVEVIPPLVDDSAPYGVYVNCAWLPGGDMLAESYTLEQGSTNRIVAHLEGIYFRKVPLTTLELGLTLAAGPVSPEPSKPDDTMASPRSTFTRPFSNYFAEVKPGVALSKSRSRSGSLLSLNVNKDTLGSLCNADSSARSQSHLDTKEAADGNALEVPCRDLEVSHTSDPQVEQFSDSEDDTCRSDVNALLAAILGLELEELREDVDLELLGLDSLASIEAHHALRSHFAIALPSDLFMIHTSAKAIQSFITSRLLANRNSDDGGTHSRVNSTDTTHPKALRSENADYPNTLPISVQRTKQLGRVPLLLIHDGSGLVTYIRNLPSLGRDLWGIYNPYIINGRPWESVVSMAAEYAKYTIEAGLGPILLGGWNLAFFWR
jgi:iterative type I PKS product template protein